MSIKDKEAAPAGTGFTAYILLCLLLRPKVDPASCSGFHVPLFGHNSSSNTGGSNVRGHH